MAYDTVVASEGMGSEVRRRKGEGDWGPRGFGRAEFAGVWIWGGAGGGGLVWGPGFDKYTLFRLLVWQWARTGLFLFL